jgi:hypothetical protein
VPATKAAASETSATVVPTAEAPAAKVAAKTTTEVTAPTTAAGVAAEGRGISGREHVERSRDGGSSEHRLECLADHETLQYIAERSVRFGH